MNITVLNYSDLLGISDARSGCLDGEELYSLVYDTLLATTSVS